MKKEDAIRRYEHYLLGKNKLRLSGEPEEKSNAAKDIVRYVVTDILDWDVKTALDHFSADIISIFKLEGVLKYIIFPKEMRGNRYEYLIMVCFPGEFYFDHKKNIADLYDGILEGSVKRFPREEFDSDIGLEKANVVLRKFISYNIPSCSSKDLYKRFADTYEMEHMFRENKIYFVYKHFYNSPLEFLHFALNEEEQDLFLFCYYSFMLLYNRPREKEVS